MNEPKEVLFTMMASYEGQPIGGIIEFLASDMQDFTESCEGSVYAYGDNVFDEVETHECD